MNYANLLSRLLNREDLPHDDMHELMRNIMSGQLTPIQIAAVLVALHMKGETVTEIAAAAQVMRDLARHRAFGIASDSGVLARVRRVLGVADIALPGHRVHCHLPLGEVGEVGGDDDLR